MLGSVVGRRTERGDRVAAGLSRSAAFGIWLVAVLSEAAVPSVLPQIWQRSGGAV